MIRRIFETCDRLTFLIVFSCLLSACEVPTPEQRPGNVFEGSIHWARDIAQPLIADFASDAELYNISGIQIYSDGRLPANTGSWGLIAWSPSRQEEFQVNVRYTGGTTTTIRARTEPPSSDGQPIPQGWVNSTDIFNAVTANINVNPGPATLVVFNIATYDSPVWGINFGSNSEPNHYVSWDGTYLGTTPQAAVTESLGQ